MTRNLDFFAIAISTDLFRFASHGQTLSKDDVAANFYALNARLVPGGLYPREHALVYETREITTPIFPLDLPRIASMTLSKSPFDPYSLSNLAKPDSHPSIPNVWQANTDHISLKRTAKVQSTLPEWTTDTLFLAPYAIQGRVFCQLISQYHQNSLIFFDGISFGYAQEDWAQVSLLPIARDVVKSSPSGAKDIVDWNLCYQQNHCSGFFLRRMRKVPENVLKGKNDNTK